jgi:hypothetical protein
MGVSSRSDGKKKGPGEGEGVATPPVAMPAPGVPKTTQRTLTMPQVIGGPPPAGTPAPPPSQPAPDPKLMPGEHRRPVAPPITTPTPMSSTGVVVSSTVQVGRTMNVGGPPSAPQRAPQQTPPRPPPKQRPSAPMQWEPPAPAPGSPAGSITTALREEEFDPPTQRRKAVEIPESAPSPTTEGKSITGELDAAFEKMLGDHPMSSAPPAHDLSGMRELFAQIAANYMRQVRDFVIELQWAEVSRDWLTICTPAVRGLRSAAAAVKIEGLCEALDAFIETLVRAEQEKARSIGGQMREELLASYGRLAQTFPAVFALGEERNRREAVIVHALLSQIPDVGKVTLDKLYGAGLGALDVMLLAKPGDVASATGLDMELAARICERFARYKKELASAEHDESRSNERDMLAALVVELRLRHDQLEAIGRETPSEADLKKRRNLRKERDAKLAEIQVALAQTGAVDLVSKLAPLPFAAKLEALEDHLKELAKASAGA